jgi:hypothetical protein
MKRIKEYIVDSVQDGYAIELLLRNISLAIASAAIGCGFVVLLCGWNK